MNNLNINISKVSLYTLIALLVYIVLFPFNPSNIIPGKDSGAFLYIGQQILDGSVPYRDFWDHKGPVIYYINALGLWLGQGSIWGLWAVQFISLYIAGVFSYLVTKKAFGNIAAIFATTIWLLSSSYVIRNGGNSTEEFTLPLSFLSLYLFLFLRQSNRSLLYLFMIGSLFSISFFLRANNIAVGISILIYIIFSSLKLRDIKKLISELSAFISGSILILIAVLLYFKSHNALEHFIDQAFTYNFLYSDSSLQDKMHSFYIGLKVLSPSGITIVAIAAWVFGLVKILNGVNLNNKIGSLIKLAIIGLPITIGLSILSGRTYPHYYITWLPMLAVLISYFAFELKETISNSSLVLFKRRTKLSVILIFSLLISMSFPALLRIAVEDEVYELKVGNWDKFKNTISQHSEDEKYIQMWGPQMGAYNFLLKKESPSKYFYLHPLLTCGYVDEAMIEEFALDIKNKKPLIVEIFSRKKSSIQIEAKDKSELNIGFIGADKQSCPDTEVYYDLTNFIRSNYEIVASHKNFKGGGWNIYKYKN